MTFVKIVFGRKPLIRFLCNQRDHLISAFSFHIVWISFNENKPLFTLEQKLSRIVFLWFKKTISHDLQPIVIIPVFDSCLKSLGIKLLTTYYLLFLELIVSKTKKHASFDKKRNKHPWEWGQMLMSTLEVSVIKTKLT